MDWSPRSRTSNRCSGRQAICSWPLPYWPNFRARAQTQALDSLGLATAYAELESIKAEKAALAAHRKQAQRALLETRRGVSI